MRDVARGHGGNHRIAPIGDDLDGCLTAVQQLLLEVLRDDDSCEDVPCIDQWADLCGIAADGDTRERRRLRDVREEIARGRCARRVDDGIRNLFNVVVGRIAEQEALDDDRHDELDAHARVLEQGQEFLLAEKVEMVEKTAEGSHGSTFFRVMRKAQPRKNKAKARSTAVSRTMSGQ